MIPDYDNLVQLFKNMNEEGFATDSELRWSFYFVDSNKENLLKVFSELEEKDYTLAEIYKVEDDEDWILKASKVDILTPEKLHRRNIAFNELAAYCGVDEYDGWDVEKID
ncbi:MAG: ribonuclease E inhibitor RraB [Bacteroidota bacterium]